MEFTPGVITFHVLLLSIIVGYNVQHYTGPVSFVSNVLLFIILDFLWILHSVIRGLKPTTPTMDVRGKNAMITGGSSGIGLSIGKSLSSLGANVILVARNQDRLESAVAECTSFAKDASCQKIQCASIDITGDFNILTDQMNNISQDFGAIDILINCAGFSIPGEFLEAPISDFSTMMSTNYLGAVQMTRACAEHMKRQKLGQIVFLSSLAGQVACYGYSSYASAKFALKGLAEVLTAELTPYNIGVTLVFPPDTDTPGFATEAKTKPKITELISDGIGIWTAEQVASKIVDAVQNRSRSVVVGADGFFALAATCGGYLPDTLCECLAQALLAPILRIYLVFLQNSFANITKNNLEAS